MRWTYVVRNTGDVTLAALTVTDDDPGVTVSCLNESTNAPVTILGPSQSVTCTAVGTVSSGEYVNVGTATGTPSNSQGDPTGDPDVTDSDESHYDGLMVDAAIEIEKSTCDAAGVCDDADVAPGPTLTAGSAVSWEILVRNVGTAALTGVSVTDSDESIVVDCQGETTLAASGQPNDSMTCTASGTAQVGQYANIGTATGEHTPSGQVVSDSDASHYNVPTAVTASIEIEKSTNGEDADTAPGPSIPEGEEVVWRYDVTNTGGVPLTSIEVTDDPLGTVCTGEQAALLDGPLDPNQTVTCVETGVATVGQYVNIGTVIASAATGIPDDLNTPEDESTETVTASDSSHYLGLGPVTIDIEKATCDAAGVCVDADSAPGPTLAVGSAVSWEYAVTNTGGVPLSNIVVSDSEDVGTITCPATSLPAAGNPGDSMTCTAAGLVVVGQYSNIGSASGTADDGSERTAFDSDPSHYFAQVATAAIVIEKRTNGLDTGAGPGPTLDVDSVVEWTYDVTNAGNVTLGSPFGNNELTVTDLGGPVGEAPQAVTVFCPEVSLDPQESMTCTASGTVIDGEYENSATATGQPVDANGLPIAGEPPVTATDSSHYTGGSPGGQGRRDWTGRNRS